MKPIVRIILALAALAACLFLWLVGDRVAASARHEVTCKAVDAVVTDSLQRRFVSPDDIQDWMADYGTWAGLRLDSVDLCRVESIIDGKSAVRKSQAWLTDDGVLHVSVTQREPVVRFQGPSGGFYADREGYLFPLQSRFTARVPVVDGALRVKLEKNFKGKPATEKEQEWVQSVLVLVKYLADRKEWGDLVGQINVLKSGDLVLIPREGTERFLFGTPTHIEAKFGRIQKYYEGVAPTQETPYNSVDVRYDNQIVCRRQNNKRQ